MKIKLNMKIISISLFIAIIGYFIKDKNYNLNEIYVNRFVYLKKDNTLFTGTLKVAGNSSYYIETFCEGVPCGEWAEYQNGGSYISKGKHLSVKEILSDNTIQMVSNDTSFIDYWQEGGDLPTDPYHFLVLILKDDTFFNSDIKQFDKFINQLAYAVKNDTRNLNYTYLKICFINSVYNWNKEYSKEYIVTEQKLKEITNE
jgi:hypothetical protein